MKYTKLTIIMMIKLVRFLAIWLRVKCAITIMFTHTYEEYRLHILVDISLYS